MKSTDASSYKQTELARLREQILTLAEQYAELAYAPAPFVPGSSQVLVSGKVLGPAEMRNLIDASLDFWLTTGRFNEAFEKRLASFLGRRFVLSCNSGSSANLIAMSGISSKFLGSKRLRPGDEVITCATGFPTTVNPIIQNRMVPVFVDVDIPTYNIKSDKIEAAVTDKTRAIMIAHALGNPFDLDAVMAVAKRHDLFVIEDCCDALGAEYDGKLVGTFGTVGTLSFYPAHHITMGEGGAVFAQDGIVKRALESIRDWGRDCYCAPGHDNTCKNRFRWKLGDLPYGYDHKYIYSSLGYNLKITDMQAAVGLAQMDRLEGFIAARRANFKALYETMAKFEEFFILPRATPKSNPSWFGFPVTRKDSAPFTREDLVTYLNDNKIHTRLLFGGNLIRQPYMLEQEFRVSGSLDESDKVMRDTFWMGVYPGNGAPQYQYVEQTISDFLKRY